MAEKRKPVNVVKQIRKATAKRFSAEDKIRIVLEGLRGEIAISELCRKEGISAATYYKWSKDFLNAGKNGLTLTTKRNPLPGIRRRDIDKVMLLADKILNVVHQHFVGGELMFRGLQIGGAEDLLHWLKMAWEYQEEKERGLRA